MIQGRLFRLLSRCLLLMLKKETEIPELIYVGPFVSDTQSLMTREV